MGSVAEGAVVAVLAAAEIDRPVLFRCVRGWGKVATLVGSIAKRLGRAFPTRTPVVGLTGLDIDWDG